MEEIESTQQTKSPLTKRLFAIIAIVIVIIGGALAFVFSNTSIKNKYFQAEKNTYQTFKDIIEEKYEPELNWRELTETHPTESTYSFSIEVDLPDDDMKDIIMVSPEQIINNSSLIVTTASDKEDFKASADIEARIGGLSIGNIDAYLTADHFSLGLPFLDEKLQINDDDLTQFLHTIDPLSYTGEEDIHLKDLFESTDIFFSKEDRQYLREEYLTFLYDELSDEYFTAEKETITVHNKSVKTDKITLHLLEDDVKSIFLNFFNKMLDDKRLKEMIQDQHALNHLSTNPSLEQELDQLVKDFDIAINEAIDEIDDLVIPNGLTSTIWTHKKTIVQRDFNLEIGTADEYETDTVSLNIHGTQLLNPTKQIFAYDINMKDSYEDIEMTFTGDLSTDKGVSDDSIKLVIDDFELTYNGAETLEKNDRQFERSFTMNDPLTGPLSYVWTGQATYDDDQMNSNHELSMVSPGFDDDLFTFHIQKDAELKKELDFPTHEEVIDIGSMNALELDHLVEELSIIFEQWLFNITGDSIY